MIQELNSLAAIMNALFSLETVPIKPVSPVWPSAYEAQTYLPPNVAYPRQPYLAPSVVAAQNKFQTYTKPLLSATLIRDRAYDVPSEPFQKYQDRSGRKPDMVSLLNQKQVYTDLNQPSNEHFNLMLPNGAGLQNKHGVYVSPAPKYSQKPYASSNIVAPQTLLSSHFSPPQNEPEANASPSVVNFQKKQGDLMSNNLFSYEPRVYTAPNLSSYLNTNKHVSTNLANLLNQPRSGQLSPFQIGPQAFVSTSLEALKNEPQPYFSSDLNAQSYPSNFPRQPNFLKGNINVTPNLAGPYHFPYASANLQNGLRPHFSQSFSDYQKDESESLPKDFKHENNQNPIARRTMMQIGTNDLNPETIEQLKPTPSKYIAKVVQQSIAQSSAALNDIMRKNFNIPAQTFAQAFDQTSQAFNRGSQYMNNFFNNQLQLPQIPTFPGFSQYHYNNLAPFQPITGDGDRQFHSSQAPYISPNLRPLDLDPTDDIDVRMDNRRDSDMSNNGTTASQIDSGSSLIQYGNGNQNIAVQSEVTVQEVDQSSADISEKVEDELDHELDDEMIEKPKSKVTNEMDAVSFENDVDVTTKCISNRKNSNSYPLNDKTIEVTTLPGSVALQDEENMLEDEVTTVNPLDDTFDIINATNGLTNEETTVSFGLDNRLDTNAIKTLVG